ncbi:MAG: hypothetical protein RLZZ548_155 [Bacteroidota bacterium]|jgi:hypothetical protein
MADIWGFAVKKVPFIARVMLNDPTDASMDKYKDSVAVTLRLMMKMQV